MAVEWGGVTGAGALMVGLAAVAIVFRPACAMGLS